LEVAGLLLIPERLKDKSEESELAGIFLEGRGGLVLAFLTGRLQAKTCDKNKRHHELG
jgi:hypothetical protein